MHVLEKNVCILSAVCLVVLQRICTYYGYNYISLCWKWIMTDIEICWKGIMIDIEICWKGIMITVNLNWILFSADHVYLFFALGSCEICIFVVILFRYFSVWKASLKRRKKCQQISRVCMWLHPPTYLHPTRYFRLLEQTELIST